MTNHSPNQWPSNFITRAMDNGGGPHEYRRLQKPYGRRGCSKNPSLIAPKIAPKKMEKWHYSYRWLILIGLNQKKIQNIFLATGLRHQFLSAA